MKTIRRFLLVPLAFALVAGANACGDDPVASSPPPSPKGGGSGTGGSEGGAGGIAGFGGRAGSATGGTVSAGAAGGKLAGGAAGATPSGGAAGSKPEGCVADADCSAKVPPTKPLGCAVGYCNAGVCALRAKDADGDGSRTSKCAVTSDDPRSVEVGKDCDDANAKVNPAAWDGPAGEGHENGCADGVDQNCSGADGDDVLASGASCACVPGDVSSCSETAAGVPIVFPGGTPAPGSVCSLGGKTCEKDPEKGAKWGPCINARGVETEVCNGTDDDCDGKTDEEDAEGRSEWIYDGDGDGQGATVPGKSPPVPFATVKSCIKNPPSQVPVECDAAYCGAIPKEICCPKDAWRLTIPKTDCDDRHATALVGGVEVCGNDIDENCNGKLNDLGAVGEKDWAFDGDGDGHGDAAAGLVRSCGAPVCDKGKVPTCPCDPTKDPTDPTCASKWKTGILANDCNDANPAISPKASENCKTADVDENCNGSFLDQCPCTENSPAFPPVDCGEPGDCAYLKNGSTCVSGAYNKCPDAVPQTEFCPDLDLDGYCATSPGSCGLYCASGDPAQAPPPKFIGRSSCTNSSGATDCDDKAATVNPIAPELCGDAVDSNCRSDGSGTDSDGFGVGTACNVFAAKGSGGACFGGGTLQCASPGATTTTCATPAGSSVGKATPQSLPAPNGSWDWDCDGQVSIAITSCNLAIGGACGCQNEVFGQGATTESVSAWPATSLLLVAPTAVPTCASIGTESACSALGTPHFYAVTCRASGGCLAPTCASTFGRLLCRWDPFTGAKTGCVLKSEKVCGVELQDKCF